jgi:pteridine reductase
MPTDDRRVALVTGGARRIGAAIVRRLHAAGYSVIVHHHRSVDDARALVDELEGERSSSAVALAADILQLDAIATLAEQSLAVWGRMDLVVNNASVFKPSPIGATPPARWDELIGSNLRAPFELVSLLTPALRDSRGTVVNIVDIHADQPLAGHAVYSAAKAGLAMLTRSLARDLAPEIMVNAVAPGAILWPEHDDLRDDDQHADEAATHAARAEILARIPMGRQGMPLDIAEAVLFLAGAPYITGQILRVDGGRHMT